MEQEGIALRLMHLYRLRAAAGGGEAKRAIEREIDRLTARLDEAFAAADRARRDADEPRLRR